jgi:hypothetical protein
VGDGRLVQSQGFQVLSLVLRQGIHPCPVFPLVFRIADCLPPCVVVALRPPPFHGTLRAGRPARVPLSNPSGSKDWDTWTLGTL